MKTFGNFLRRKEFFVKKLLMVRKWILGKRLVCRDCLLGLVLAAVGVAALGLRGCGVGDGFFEEALNEAGRVLEGYERVDGGEFVDAVPDVRGSVDRGIESIQRKRDEVLQRVRSGGAGE
jgi:hypothetical protein